MKKLFYICSAVILFMSMGYGFFVNGSGDNPLTSTAANITSISLPNTFINANNNKDQSLVGGWTTGANIPTQDYVGGSVGYSRNDTGWLFVVGGNEPSAAGNITMAYNFKTNTWATLATLPISTVANACAVLKDSIYELGGYLGGSAACTNVYRYSINTNTWLQVASLPATSGWCEAVGYQDSLIYECRGTDGSTVYPTVYMYNCNNNTWKTATSLPGGRFGAGFTRTGDTLVFIGGADLSLVYGQTYVGVISQTDRSQITWSTKTSCPVISSTGLFRTMAAPWGPGKVIFANGSPGVSWTGSNYCYVYNAAQIHGQHRQTNRMLHVLHS